MGKDLYYPFDRGLICTIYAVCVCVCQENNNKTGPQENKQPNYKCDTDVNKVLKNGRKSLKKCSTFHSHQSNAYQNYFEISSYTSQNGQDQLKKRTA